MRVRSSITTLMIAVVAVAVATAALISASPTWARSIWWLTVSLLILASVIGYVAPRGRRAFYVGASVTGWLAFALANNPWSHFYTDSAFPTSRLIYAMREIIVRAKGWKPFFVIDGVAFEDVLEVDRFRTIIFCMLSLLIALIGGVLSRFLFSSLGEGPDA